jgi:hypothetical protein
MEFKIPTENHSRLVVPDFTEIPAAVDQNERIFAGDHLIVAGLSHTEFRSRVLDRIGRLIGLEKGMSRRIMLTAHQPGLWHPGILHKYAVINRFAHDYFLLNINVDSDVVSPVSCKVPRVSSGQFRVTDTVIVENDENRTIQALEKPPQDDMNDVFFEIERRVAALPDDSVSENFRRFLEIHKAEYRRSDTFSDWLTNCRRQYFPVPDLHEIRLSDLCNTEEFRLFASDIIENCEDFHRIYNACLDKYRAEHRIRTNVNPFPNLEHRTETNIELPFWLITSDGQRHPMCVNCRDKSILADHKEVLNGLSKDLGPSALEDYEIRPKALLLTMFMRMFVGSIFIHGVGGGNYDQVTDAVIREYYDCKPPTYIVATRTEFLPIGGDQDIDERIRQAKGELRNMRFNPDEYVEENNSLAVEKKAILSKAKNKTTKDEYRRLKEIRQILVEDIKGFIEDKEKEIGLLEQERSRLERVRRRDFPYFFYSMETLME